MSKAISGALCTLRVHYMQMRSSIVLQCIGHVPLFTLYICVGVSPMSYAYVLCMCMYVCVCVCMSAYKCVDHVIGV